MTELTDLFIHFCFLFSFQKISLEEQLYIVDNLAFFVYQTQDEPLFIIHQIDIIVSVSGSNLLQSFREVSILPLSGCFIQLANIKDSYQAAHPCRQIRDLGIAIQVSLDSDYLCRWGKMQIRLEI